MKLSFTSLLLIPFVPMLKAEQASRKNLVIIMADQWRGDAFGFLGKEAVQTPHLDKFAANSVVIEQCVSGYPVSSPARAMFLTGAYPWNNGVPANCNSQNTPHNVELRANIETWSDVLKKEGYQTGYIGKWHLDKPEEPFIDTPNNRGAIAWNEWCAPERRHGFNHWIAYGTYDYHLKPMYWINPENRDDWKYVDQWGPEFEANRAIEFIRDNRKSPFALMVSINPPHTGYELVPQRYKNIYIDLNTDSIADSWANVNKERVFFKKSLPDYYACMTGVDEQVGRILEELKANNLIDNTIIVFTSDHGDMMGTHDHIGKNVYYEEAVRVPMFIGGAGIQPRRDDRLLMSLEDASPTLLSLMGFTDAIPATTQTFDLSDQILGKSKKGPKGQLYMRIGEQNNVETNNCRGWRNARYTYGATITDTGNTVDEVLFDRQEDPFQLTNIIAEQPKIAKKMRKEMLTRLVEINDPLVTKK